jgi:hypothetical protein
LKISVFDARKVKVRREEGALQSLKEKMRVFPLVLISRPAFVLVENTHDVEDEHLKARVGG